MDIMLLNGMDPEPTRPVFRYIPLLTHRCSPFPTLFFLTDQFHRGGFPLHPTSSRQLYLPFFLPYLFPTSPARVSKMDHYRKSSNMHRVASCQTWTKRIRLPALCQIHTWYKCGVVHFTVHLPDSLTKKVLVS